MTKKFGALVVVTSMLLSAPNRAQALFGADAVILAQILANAVKQLAQLQQILGQGRDTLGLLRDVNRGINDSLQMAETKG